MQRALNECDAGKHAKDQVKGKFDKAQDQLKKRAATTSTRREEFDKKALVLKEDQRRDLEKDFEAKQLEFKRRYEDFQRDLKRTDAELTSGIVEQLYGIVTEIGQQQLHDGPRELERRASTTTSRSTSPNRSSRRTTNPNRPRASQEEAADGGGGGGE